MLLIFTKQRKGYKSDSEHYLVHNPLTTKKICVTMSAYNEEEIMKGFDDELNKAIKYRLIADVPLGTYLSGGLDSSLITAITALKKKEKVNLPLTNILNFLLNSLPSFGYYIIASY